MYRETEGKYKHNIGNFYYIALQSLQEKISNEKMSLCIIKDKY